MHRHVVRYYQSWVELDVELARSEWESESEYTQSESHRSVYVDCRRFSCQDRHM